MPLSGIPIYYHRCKLCGFIFTAAFDEFSDQEFLDHIYNENYALVDPEYAEVRPRSNAEAIARMLDRDKGISILDYGGGNGHFATALRSFGFLHVETYDPLVPKYSARPDRQYDCIVCYEVLEHSIKPSQTIHDMNSLLNPEGLLLFSTLLQPPDINDLGASWWYLAPRNGHVSLYTQPALAALFRPVGLQLGSLNSAFHAAWRHVPQFARHLIKG
jgi:2-polyprenyl-6-hydroxyphenyl methylase/3-demethylubiquinone-9 3-methyltransferase